MSKVLFDLVTEMRQKDMEAQRLSEKYLQDFDTMLLVEPIEKLVSKTLESNYRGRLARYFEKELDARLAIPEYRDTYIKEFGLEHIEYETGSIHLESWFGDECAVLKVPVLSFSKLREVQEAALAIVSSLNALYESRKEEKEAKETEERRALFLKLQQEFGNE